VCLNGYKVNEVCKTYRKQEEEKREDRREMVGVVLGCHVTFAGKESGGCRKMHSFDLWQVAFIVTISKLLIKDAVPLEKTDSSRLDHISRALNPATLPVYLSPS